MLLAFVSATLGANRDLDPPPRMSQWVIDSDSAPRVPPLRAPIEDPSPAPPVTEVPAASARSRIEPHAVYASTNAGFAGSVGPNRPVIEAARRETSSIGSPQQNEQPAHAAEESPWIYDNDAAPVEDLWLLPKLFRPDAYGRYHGEGEPLVTASWLNRPYYAGFFLGGFDGDTLISGEINQSLGFFGGARLGWDYDAYWGVETRLGFTELGLDFVEAPSVAGLSNEITVWDASLIYYPWGDARWRPYLTVGIGLVDSDYLNIDGVRHSDAVLGVPWGGGLKYRQSDWITLRLDVLDNVAFGDQAGFETMNNLSLTGGMEFRFGGTRKSYFPWNPSRTIR